MAAVAKALLRATGVDIEVETLETLIIFSCVGLLISLVLAITYGLDLSPGLF